MFFMLYPPSLATRILGFAGCRLHAVYLLSMAENASWYVPMASSDDIGLATGSSEAPSTPSLAI